MGTIVRPRRLLRSNSDCVLRNGKKLPALWPAWVAKESTTPVQTSRSSLLDLPEELLLEAILPHMDHRDLFSLSQVCRRLNVLAVSGLMLSHASPSNAKCFLGRDAICRQSITSEDCTVPSRAHSWRVPHLCQAAAMLVAVEGFGTCSDGAVTRTRAGAWRAGGPRTVVVVVCSTLGTPHRAATRGRSACVVEKAVPEQG